MSRSSPGVGRRVGIAAAIAVRLAEEGWDLVLPHWSAYDERIAIGGSPAETDQVVEAARALGAVVAAPSADLADPESASRILATADGIGAPRALVLSHSESVDSGVLTTTVEAWDRHFAVNARAAWLLIRGLAERLPDEPTCDARARVVALTSDHTAFNLPYGASKGALDRLVIAAATELGPRGMRANVINPGPIDTGWMNDEIRAAALAATPVGRLGTPADIADAVAFLLGDRGSWITGQRLFTNGGFRTSE